MCDVVDGLFVMLCFILLVYFYDQVGLVLFDQIIELLEYYVMWMELDLLESIFDELLLWVGLGVVVIELGLGFSVKICILLDVLGDVVVYVGFDIFKQYLVEVCEELV